MKTYIFIHDQDMLLDFINADKFKNLDNVNYVFLGNRSTDKLNCKNLIVCRDLPINIEEYPLLTSFTGWYALWKNNLCDFDYANFFEYDITVADNFTEIQKPYLDGVNKIIGYVQFNIHDILFLKIEKYSRELVESIHKTYSINATRLIDSLPDMECSITSNHTFSIDAFNEYMKWVEPMIDDFKHTVMAGHQAERSVPLFYLIKNINFKLIPNILRHYQLDSHKTQGFSENKLKDNYFNLLNNIYEQYIYRKS
jgi:hypothetical protein